MAKIAKKLTDTEIKSTKPAEKEVNLFDGDGLLLRIAPLAKGGKKNWYFRYAVPVTKKRTKVSFLVALNNASIRLETRLLIEWQLLTWVRPGEAVRTRWSDIDIETGMWNIPAEFMKMKKPHKVPLSKEALRVLDLMKVISGHREWVFPSIKAPLNHMHEQTANAAIIRMGFGGELVAHGMRSIARTAAEESGKFRTDVLEAALAHSKKDEIIAAYNRAEYLTERVVLMQWWSDYVSSQKCKVIAA